MKTPNEKHIRLNNDNIVYKIKPFVLLVVNKKQSYKAEFEFISFHLKSKAEFAQTTFV